MQNQHDSQSTPLHTGIQTVLFIAPFGLGQKTTVWARILPLAQYLSRQNIRVSILLPPWDTPAHSGLIWQDEGVTVENVRSDGGPPAMLARLLLRVRRHKPDIVHIVKPLAYAGAVQSLLWIFRKPGRHRPKIVLDIDDWEQGWATLNNRAYWIRRLVTWQEQWGHTHADGITAASHWLVEQVKQRRPDMPVTYIPNGITDHTDPLADQDLHAVHPHQTRKSASPAPTVLYFTRFIEIPPAWLVDFCSELFRNHPGITLNIAGSGIHSALETSFLEEFQNRAHAAQLDTTRIRWLGHVSPHALADLHATTTCAIFPSRSTPLLRAKCSVKLATTLLHGVPVVASAVGEQKQYGTAGAMQLVDAEATPQEFACAVLEVINHPARQTNRQRRARPQLLAHYDWNRLGAQLHDFYQSLLR